MKQDYEIKITNDSFIWIYTVLYRISSVKYGFQLKKVAGLQSVSVYLVQNLGLN